MFVPQLRHIQSDTYGRTSSLQYGDAFAHRPDHVLPEGFDRRDEL